MAETKEKNDVIDDDQRIDANKFNTLCWKHKDLKLVAKELRISEEKAKNKLNNMKSKSWPFPKDMAGIGSTRANKNAAQARYDELIAAGVDPNEIVRKTPK